MKDGEFWRVKSCPEHENILFQLFSHFFVASLVHEVTFFPLRSHKVTYFCLYFCKVKREDHDLNEVTTSFLRYHEVILFIQNWCKVIKMSDKVTWGHPRSGENTKFHAKLDNKMFGEEVKIIYEERMSLYFAHITYTAENYIIMHYWWTRSSSITTIFGSCSFVRINTVVGPQIVVLTQNVALNPRCRTCSPKMS